ncbi:MAG TPA: hypothetical protein VN228_04380, partial [Pyrinomonadaceae bacterium]|nr:hypothetical protein [Pyrinomonadaceae bacterium]
MRRVCWRRLGAALSLAAGLAAAAGFVAPAAAQSDVKIPDGPLTFGVFVVQFDPGGTFTLKGDRWPALGGSWKGAGDEIEVSTSGGPEGCGGPGRYKVRVDGRRVGFDLVADDCTPRRMILDRSIWSPPGEARP